MIKLIQRTFKIIVYCSAVLAVTACVQTGYNYNTALFSQIKAGESTLDDVNRILGAHPTNVYRALDGSFTAMYSHKSSILADAIYFNKELLLAFDNEGKYKNVVGGASKNPESETNNTAAVTSTNNTFDNNKSQQTTFEEDAEVIVIERDDAATKAIKETIVHEKATQKTVNQTKNTYDKCPSDCSLNAPSTYPVYLKRSGSNVIKRYDIKE